MNKTVKILLFLVMTLSVTLAYEAILKSTGELPKGQNTTQITEKAIPSGPVSIDNNVVVKRAYSAGPSAVTQRSHDPETVPVRDNPVIQDSRFASIISHGSGATGVGGFIFNTGDSAAVWYRPDTECTVDGVQLYFHYESELIGTDVTIVVREVLDVTSTGLEANGVYDFSYYNATTGDFMGDVLYSYTLPLTTSDVYPTMLDIDFDQQVDVAANDFAIQVIGDFGSDGADLMYYAGVGGSGTTYNHGFKYYATGASYCDEGCWVPRLNFIVDAKVDYYGDPPPFITEVEDLPDVYASCDGGPYYATANIVDVGTAEFTGALTSVIFGYNIGGDDIEAELVGTGVGDVFTGEIPSLPVGTTVEYWWKAVDNGDENPAGGVIHETDLRLTPESFTVREYTEGADVLVLDDGPNALDETYAARVADALYELGYSADFWNTKSGGSLTDCELSNYAHLVLIQGLNSEGNLGLGSQLETDVMAFLDNGGNLLFSSADYIYGVTEGTTDGWTTTDAAAYPFLANYLHTAEFWSDANYYGADDGSTDTLYTGVEGNLLTGTFLDPFIAYSPEASNWADEIIPDGDAESIFMVHSTEEEDWVDFGGLMFEGDYKLVFVPWHLEGIDDDAIFGEFLDNTMVWFGVECVPVISAIDGPSGPMFSSDDVTVVATAEDCEGDAFTVDLVYTIGGEATTVAMTDNGDGTFTGTIPGQEGGTTVLYHCVATDAGGSFVTTDVDYFVYAPSADVLFVLNNEMDSGSYPGLYYFYDAYVTESLFVWPDFWESSANGLPTAELLAFYDIVFEITTTADYPFYGALHTYYDGVLSDWLALGNKNYVLAGDETFGIYNMSWGDVDFAEGSFFHNLGVASTLNDINASGISEIATVAGDPISGAMNAAEGGDVVLYDPDYEIGFANWLDGLVPTADGVACFTSGDAAVGVHKTWANGNQTLFLGFDPLSLNDDPYVWWGAKEEGSLKQALDWIIDDSVDELKPLPTTFVLHQNYPNPFNPTTTIAFDVPQVSDVKVTIYNLLGHAVSTIDRSSVAPGQHHVVWNGTNQLGQPVSSGVYFYKIEAADYTATKKMMFLK